MKVELDELISELETFADEAETRDAVSASRTLRKAAETIKLMRELIVEENNEKGHRMIDDMEKKDG